MSAKTTFSIWTAGTVLGLALAGNAMAADVLCQNVNLNHMLIDDSQVELCLDAGVGNLTGNPANDLFINGAGDADDYVLASKSDSVNPYSIQFTQTGATGTWSFDASAWDDYSQLALGFKFGTGNQPDEWFVYSLAEAECSDLAGTCSGDWEFVNVFGEGGGLSHVNLYGTEGTDFFVPTPGVAALLGLGMIGMALARRRRG